MSGTEEQKAGGRRQMTGSAGPAYCLLSFHGFFFFLSDSGVGGGSLLPTSMIWFALFATCSIADSSSGSLVLLLSAASWVRYPFAVDVSFRRAREISGFFSSRRLTSSMLV